MDNLDDSENNAKVSDSAYSTSCSNSQSRRSHSSKSTNSGSHSSRSSGYCGQQSTSGSSNHLNQPADKKTKEKNGKKKKQAAQTELVQTQADVEFRQPDPAPVCEAKKKVLDAVPSPAVLPQAETDIENMDTATDMHKCEDVSMVGNQTAQSSMQVVMSRPCSPDGFSCVISMHDGIVMYTTSSLTSTLGFPKDMWIGRSFIEFIHPLDHSTYASQITSGFAVPENVYSAPAEAAQPPSTTGPTMFCRIRRYRGLKSSFCVKDTTVSYMPLMLKLSFKNFIDEKGLVIYMVVQATPLFSAFKTAHEIVVKPVPFFMRHVSNGILEYIDHKSVPFLGYLPQDITGKDVLHLYHPDDLIYVRQVYETIAKEGGAPRTKPYRMMAQNGLYLKLETEWSSFINPWSRKIEFVVGKHHVVEGPANPDVFLPPVMKVSDEKKNKNQGLRDSIVKILSHALTKPAEFAKQQMTKRCQDLASYMENLMEQHPKEHDELRLEIQEHENSCFERDSVMLGGISPHHDYSDSKSSTATPLSYNQLNFNENLQRYFDSHKQTTYEEYIVNTGMPNATMTAHNTVSGGCFSPMAEHSGDSAELTSSGESTGAAFSDNSPIRDHQALRLTESLLIKHNSEMEKTLVMQHRECRVSNKESRDKASNETKQKKRDHLARCNAYFVPNAADSSVGDHQPHGVKRASKQFEAGPSAHKHHCAAPQALRGRPLPDTTLTASCPDTSSAPYSPNMGIPQPVSLVNPMTSVPGLIPLYYVPSAGPPMPPYSEIPSTEPNTPTQFQTQPVSYMMYGQAVFGSPVVVSPINPQVQYHNVMPQQQYASAQKSLGLTANNYEQACKPRMPLKPGSSPAASLWREKRRATETQGSSSNMDHTSGNSSVCSASNALKRSTEVFTDTSTSRNIKMKGSRIGNSDETVDRTDGESSYSSFYSSFFKTESGSAEDSGDARKGRPSSGGSMHAGLMGKDSARGTVMRRKREPPWMEQVCVTSKLIYKYQLMTKNMDEVLSADKQQLALLQQPSLVNEQLGQLYMDLELEGVAARLTLEEGVTSSSSSGEDDGAKFLKNGSAKRTRRRREYNKLWMMYEEDTPLPSPEAPNEPEPSSSLS